MSDKDTPKGHFVIGPNMKTDGEFKLVFCTNCGTPIRILVPEDKPQSDDKRKRVYICGPMTGLPENNYPAFHEAAKQLRAQGFDVVSPAELDHGDEKCWEDYLRRDIRGMMDCDTIAVLPGADNSKGATFERMIAATLKFDVMYL